MTQSAYERNRVRRRPSGSTSSNPRCFPLQRLEPELIAARQALDDPANAEHLRRSPPRIERLLSLLCHRYGARKSRCIGSAKAC